MIPTRADWGVIDGRDLDAQCAFDAFCGKSAEEAEALFCRNALFYQEALPSMPARAFRFYAPVLARYVTGPESRGDPDGASSFLHLLVWMLESSRSTMDAGTEALLVEAARRVSSRQAFHEANPDIYGDFAEVMERIEQLLAT